MVSGSARWDLEANKLNQYIVGAGYADDCFVLAANYVTSYSYSAGTTPPCSATRSCCRSACGPSRIRPRRPAATAFSSVRADLAGKYPAQRGTNWLIR